MHFEKIEMIKRPGAYWWGDDADHKARFMISTRYNHSKCVFSSGSNARLRQGTFTSNTTLMFVSY